MTIHTADKKIFIALLVLCFIATLGYNSFYKKRKKAKENRQREENEGASTFPKAPEACELSDPLGQESSEISTRVMEIVNETKISQLAKQHKIVVLFIYKEGCPYCKRLAPKIDQLANESNHEVIVVKIEKNNAKKLTQRDDVGPYPTVVIYKRSEIAKIFPGCSQKSAAFFSDKINLLLENEKGKQR